MDTLLVPGVAAAGFIVGWATRFIHMSLIRDKGIEPKQNTVRGYRGPHTHQYTTVGNDGLWRCGVKGNNGQICNKVKSDG